MNTIQSLEKFISELNVAWESPYDIENFYDFSISSCINDEYIEKDEFFEIFKSSNNILNKQCRDEQIQDYFSRYERYMDLLNYMKKEWSMIYKDMNDDFISKY